MRNAPGLAPAVLLALGFLAFALAVGRASAPPGDAAQRGRFHAIERLLLLRRNRARYAFVFAAAGTVLATATLVGFAGIGTEIPLHAGLGLVLQMLAIFFVAAWVLIGEVACTHDAIRRALKEAREQDG
ncbi:hypothetical protein [Albidovulum aquaemixtae]|nr:hypothetical protein [Defluviimonas aquaemixtae]